MRDAEIIVVGAGLSGLVAATRLHAAGRRVDPAAVVAPDATLVGPCAVLAGAQIGAGAVVGPYAFVDRDAEVTAGSRLVDAVVWPGARVEGAVEGAVVM